ncbi:MAG: hypothetical protein FJ280_17440 [Planctomycetes bacterium]|nr:hypothetical protein [Planctomycetota bacterium]
MKRSQTETKGTRDITGKGHPRRARGIALPWTALVLLMMLLMTGLSIDWGKIAFNVHELQNAADAAALAGAQWVRIDQAVARERAQQLGGANDTEKLPVQLDLNDEENLPDGDIVLGRYDRDLRTFTPTEDAPNAVQVNAHRTTQRHGPLAMLFGPLAGVHTADAQRRATALCTGFTGAGLIILARNPGEFPKNITDALTIAGSMTLDIQGGTIHVNSDRNSVKFNSVPTFMQCEALDVGAPSGDIHFGAVNPTTLPFHIHYRRPPVADPLKDLWPPDYSDESMWPDLTPGGKAYSITGGTVTLQPGYYSEGISISTGANVTFSPGIYVLGHQKTKQGSKLGLEINGGNVTAHGAMFYIAGGEVSLTGGAIDMLPPGADGTVPPADQEQAKLWAYYKDVTIFQSRDNPDNPATVKGNANFNIGGILYFPKNHVSLSGTSANPFRPGDQLICNTMEISGTGSLEIQYKGRDALMGFMSVLVHTAKPVE